MHDFNEIIKYRSYSLWQIADIWDFKLRETIIIKLFTQGSKIVFNFHSFDSAKEESFLFYLILKVLLDAGALDLDFGNS